LSQSKPYSGDQGDPLGYPIASPADLVQFFINAQRKRDSFLVGVEYEKFAYDLKNYQPLSYEKSPGIKQLLQHVLSIRQEKRQPYQGIVEDNNLIGLMGGISSMTLEPGGQVELSGAPFRSLHDVNAEIGEYDAITSKAAADLGVGFLSVGYHPTASRDGIYWMPKQRYQIMRTYMPKVGSRGLDMMLRTCTVQANMDYENEADMVLSVQSALVISPIVTALFANSPFCEGKPSGFLSERTIVWHDTDPVRCGFPAVALAADFGFEKWIEYTLDVPMYFVRRQGEYIDMTGIPFRIFMKQGANKQIATMRDFADHLTTIFTEVRVKPQIELRSADAVPLSHLCALAAFWKGILYAPLVRQKAYELMQEPTVQELKQLQVAAARSAFQGAYRDRSILTIAEQLVEMSRDGLISLGEKQSAFKGEEKFLKPLFELLEKRETLAEKMLQRYHTIWNGDVSKIFSMPPLT
jgi:glutamate--cysteine ligase